MNSSSVARPDARDAKLEPLADFAVWLVERAEWLKSERLRGGDWEHLLTRERELEYVTEKYLAALAKATGETGQ